MEMAQNLVAHGDQVDALVLVDTWAPQTLALAAVEQTEGALIEALAGELGLDVTPGEIEAMQPDARLPHVAARAAMSGLFSAANAERHLSRLLRVLKAHAEAMRSYTPRRYDGPFTLIRAAESLTPEAAARIEDPTCGWAAWSAGPINVRVIPGNHFNIVRPPYVSALATMLRSIFNGSQATGSDHQ
jgi:thioesterase domain-containing protein